MVTMFTDVSVPVREYFQWYIASFNKFTLASHFRCGNLVCVRRAQAKLGLHECREDCKLFCWLAGQSVDVPDRWEFNVTKVSCDPYIRSFN